MMKKAVFFLGGFIGLFFFGLTATTISYGQVTPTIPAYLPVLFNPHPTPTFTLTPTPTRTPTATATLPGPTNTPTRTPVPANVKITYILYGPTNGAIEEYVRIQNLGGSSATLTNWTLEDESNHVYLFPSFSLSPGAQVQVWTKSGTNNSTNLFWGSGQAVWNNGGDTATLRNSGGQVISVCSYSGGGQNHTCP